MFGEQNNDKAMDDAMDDGNVGNMFFSFKKKRRRMTNITNEWICKKCTFKHRYHSNECMMCFNANPDVAYSLMPTARMVSDYTNDPLGTSETTLPYTLSPQKSTIRASKRAKNTTVSYCDTIDSDIEDESITADYDLAGNVVFSDVVRSWF